MSTGLRSSTAMRSSIPFDSFDSLDSSFSHRKLRSSFRERQSPPPPPSTTDKAIQCELKKCRKTVQEAARTNPNSVNKIITKREYNDNKWAYSDRERKAQQSALASAYPNPADIPDENVLDHRPTNLEFRYSKFTKQIPVSSIEQQVTQKKKVTNDYEQGLKFNLYAYKPGMDGKRQEKLADRNNNNNVNSWENSQVNSNRTGEVIYSQVDVSKKKLPKNPQTFRPSNSPLPDYSDNEIRRVSDRTHNLRSRSASPARPPLSSSTHNKTIASGERLKSYQFGFQSALAQPLPPSSNASTLSRKTSALQQSDSSKIWPDSSPLPSSSQPAPLHSGSLLRRISSSQQRSQSNSNNNQITYSTFDRHLTPSEKLQYENNSASLNDRTAFTLDRKHMSDRTNVQKSYRSSALNRSSSVSNSCNDLMHPPTHIAPSPPPPPPPPQFSDSPNSLSYSRSHTESDYLQPRRCGSRLSVAYGSSSNVATAGQNKGQVRSQSMIRSQDAYQKERTRSPITSSNSSRSKPTNPSTLPPRSFVTRSASLNSSSQRPILRTSSPSHLSNRLPPEPRPVSRSSTRSQVRIDQPIVVQLPSASALAQNRRLSSSMAGGLNQIGNGGALYRSSEQVNRLANRMGSSMSINQSTKQMSTSRSSLKSSSKPPLGFSSTPTAQSLASSSSHLKRAQSIPKNAKLPLLQKLKSKLGKSSKD